ncbi:hypothetical protein QBZ16_003344 [Prototheca wickerhamii]|uniref:Tyrosine--tRNA ligase n=1 Tax=Prototheca wickerhamii TaxID=3111 RepID=A0AAD9IJU8_PROWI|nr:hypothetical protein QBZ16_003344 [Prototheca wickerhamii]
MASHEPMVLGAGLDVPSKRGLLADIAGDAEAFASAAARGPLRIYCGVDPTAESLHVGNLLCLMVFGWCRRLGHVPVCLLGGATGRVGDPSGKSVERPLLDEEQVAANAAKIAGNVSAILRRVPGASGPDCLMLDNYSWWKDMTVLDFLRDVGRHARMGTMLAKDSVRNRLQSDSGLSFTEFSYQLLQGYDFVHLCKAHGVTVQFGGSDQWGNITAGTELIRKTLDGQEAFGFTIPLLLKSDGSKYGKSESGAIWLSEAKLSPYGFYQALLNTADADVDRLLRALTFLPLDEIQRLQGAEQPPNTAQRRLAEEVTHFVHGEEGLRAALQATQALAPGSKVVALSGDVIRAAMEAGAVAHAVPRCDAVGAPVVDVLAATQLQPSKAAARRLIQGRGLRINNALVEDAAAQIAQADLIDGRYLLVAMGKKLRAVLEVV